MKDMIDSFRYYNGNYPLHYSLFKHFRWYRKLTKGLWIECKLEENYFRWFRIKNELATNMSAVVKVEDWR